jgi:anti-sigma-K factor RskA
MNDDPARELLGAWALDAVDDVERAAVERAIREDPELAEEARALRETAALLAVGEAAAPPAGVRDNVLTTIAQTEQEDPVPRTRPDRAGAAPAARGGHGRGRWIVAAAVLLATAIPTGLAVQQAQRAQHAEEQVTSLAEALTRPDARVLRADVEGGGRAVAVVTDDDTIFSAQGLPALTDDRAYQLWVIDEGSPSSAGVLPADEGSVSAEVGQLPDGAVLALTVEPAGGSAQPTTTPILTLPTSA